MFSDFCKSLSKSEALGELSSISSEDDESESEKGFHHPFLLKERPSSIIMNIKVRIILLFYIIDRLQISRHKHESLKQTLFFSPFLGRKTAANKNISRENS